MKTTKFLLGSILCLCLFCFSSCEDNDPVSEVYSFGLFEIKGSFDDMAKVENFLKLNDCPTNKIQLYTAKNLAETDKKAKEDFDKIVSKLSVDEIKALGLLASCSFTYAVARSDENHETVYAASFSYPQ